MKKQNVGNVSGPEMPVYIRAVGVVLEPEDRQYLRKKLTQKLHKFASTVERTSVRIKDLNGPRGGVDKSCRIKVVLHGLPSIVVEEQHESLHAVMDAALTGTERAVRRAIDQRRTKPLKNQPRELRKASD